MSQDKMTCIVIDKPLEGLCLIVMTLTLGFKECFTIAIHKNEIGNPHILYLLVPDTGRELSADGIV
jgi:hypothetical protein